VSVTIWDDKKRKSNSVTATYEISDNCTDEPGHYHASVSGFGATAKEARIALTAQINALQRQLNESKSTYVDLPKSTT